MSKVLPERKSDKTYYFKDHPEFRPNLSPREIFKLGSFGGTYWRPIHSRVTNKNYKNQHKKYPDSWWAGLDEKHLTTPWDKYDVSLNKYGKKVGTTLEFWEDKGWIKPSHPYGWIQWYCDFFMGKRSKDDERQIDRWLGLAGENGRFRKWLITQIQKKKGNYKDDKISPAIRQTLQHWAYALTKSDYEKELQSRKTPGKTQGRKNKNKNKKSQSKTKKTKTKSLKVFLFN